jgi:hypothetical protein
MTNAASGVTLLSAPGRWMRVGCSFVSPIFEMGTHRFGVVSVTE